MQRLAILALMLMSRNLFIVIVIAVVNALGYGIIIPVIYSYSRAYGLSDFQNGLLFSLFSICQFISTPIIGRMSDKYGRRPLLIVSIAGTAVSFFMAAFAPSAIYLFIARALDGLTAGNLPVISAVISDTTQSKDRARGFAIMGAALGFGFVFGPAISALTVGYGESVPFIIAGIITLIATLLTACFLPETNRHIGEVKKGKLFDFNKLTEAIKFHDIGRIFMISLVYSTVFGIFIFAFQPFSVELLGLRSNSIAIIFTAIGIVGVVTQVFLLPYASRRFGEIKTLQSSFLIISAGFAASYITRSLIPFFSATVVIALGNSFVSPLVQTLLSKETDAKSQGTIMGLNSSYVSIGSTIGPIIGGALASLAIPLPFILCSLLSATCYILSLRVKAMPTHKESAF